MGGADLVEEFWEVLRVIWAGDDGEPECVKIRQRVLDDYVGKVGAVDLDYSLGGFVIWVVGIREREVNFGVSGGFGAEYPIEIGVN